MPAREDAEDAVQQAFLAVAERFDRLEHLPPPELEETSPSSSSSCDTASSAPEGMGPLPPSPAQMESASVRTGGV